MSYINYLDYLIRNNNNIILTDNLKFNENDKGLINSTQDNNITSLDDKIITTKYYVDNNSIGRHYNSSLNGEIFNDYTNNIASGDYSSASGFNNVSNENYMFVVGKFNNNSSNEGKLFVVGNGMDNNNRNDAFIVYENGECYADVFTTENADYAELFEIYDKSINKDNYKYKFLSLIGDKVKIASSNDNYILGVCSLKPGILGNKQLYKPNINDYIAVGLIGKLIVIDNGKCIVDQFCKVDNNGCADLYNDKLDGNIPHYRVIKRYDENKIFIIFK